MDGQQSQFTTNTEEYANQQPVHVRGNNNRKKASVTVDKRTVKYLAVCSNPQAYRAVLRAAPDSVIKAIANAALNIERGDIHLSSAHKALFSTNRRAIATLTSSKVGIRRKRKVVESQRGGLRFLPILIGTALGALGGRLFGGTGTPTQ